MAQIIWMNPALTDLDRIADYIAFDNPEAAARLVDDIFRHVGQLIDHPVSGSYIPELKDRRYRQIVEPPCRIFYKYESPTVHVIAVYRSEQQIKVRQLRKRAKDIQKS